MNPCSDSSPVAARQWGSAVLAPALREKLDLLATHLESRAPLLIAFSGGVDSAFLLAVASRAVPDAVRAVLGVSASLSAESHEIARRVAQSLGVLLEEVPTGEVELPRYQANGPDRCFHCKDTLYATMTALCDAAVDATLMDGTNLDDVADVRPGRRAAALHRVESPLLELGWSKAEIREASHALGLETWDRPASPCLSSRVPHGTRVTPDVLRRIEAAEAGLRALGFAELRVRHHDTIARLELPAGDMDLLLARRAEVVEAVLRAGYLHVTLDLGGYRVGGADGATRRVIPTSAIRAVPGASSESGGAAPGAAAAGGNHGEG